MPVMGPDYDKSKADEAYNEVLQLLVLKYNIQRLPPAKYPTGAAPGKGATPT